MTAVVPRLLGLLFLACGASQPSPEPAVPARPTVNPDAPALGEVMAVEVEEGDRPRRATRDPAGVAAVRDALGPGASWAKAADVPRCPPALWARLVPPDGEGGASVSLCAPDAPAHLHVPGEGVFVLDEAHSRALVGVLGSLPLPELGAVPPTVVTDHLDGLLIGLTIALPPDAPRGLRSLTLAVGHRAEPDARWDDGSPVGTHRPITVDQAREVVAALALAGFFHRGEAFASAATEPAGARPAGRRPGPPPSPVAPAGQVQLTVTADGWHHTWSESTGKPVFAHTAAALGRAGLGDEAVSALDGLVAQLP